MGAIHNFNNDLSFQLLSIVLYDCRQSESAYMEIEPLVFYNEPAEIESFRKCKSSLAPRLVPTEQ